jgi:hypothetical protein
MYKSVFLLNGVYVAEILEVFLYAQKVNTTRRNFFKHLFCFAYLREFFFNFQEGSNDIWIEVFAAI